MTLTPRGKLTASKPEELIVNGALVTDTLGREIDGDDDGQAGGDYIATISGSRVTAGGLPLARTRRQPATRRGRGRSPARSRRADRVYPVAASPALSLVSRREHSTIRSVGSLAPQEYCDNRGTNDP